MKYKIIGKKIYINLKKLLVPVYFKTSSIKIKMTKQLKNIGIFL